MIKQILEKLAPKNIRPYFSMGALGVYMVAAVSFSVAWAGTKVIQRNYRLMREIAVLEQQADIAEQRVENQKLLNEYYKSDAYLELAARRQLNKAAPGERLMIIPKEVALSKVAGHELPEDEERSDPKQETTPTNWQAWFQFLTGRGLE